MIIDAIEVDDLSQNSEEAFMVFEERLRAVLPTTEGQPVNDLDDDIPF